jgi:hypothetical protein
MRQCCRQRSQPCHSLHQAAAKLPPQSYRCRCCHAAAVIPATLPHHHHQRHAAAKLPLLPPSWPPRCRKATAATAALLQSWCCHAARHRCAAAALPQQPPHCCQAAATTKYSDADECLFWKCSSKWGFWIYILNGWGILMQFLQLVRFLIKKRFLRGEWK